MIRVSKASGPRFVEGGGGGGREGGDKRVMDVEIERASVVTYSLFTALAKLMADLKLEARIRAGVKLHFLVGFLCPGLSALLVSKSILTLPHCIVAAKGQDGVHASEKVKMCKVKEGDDAPCLQSAIAGAEKLLLQTIQQVFVVL